MHQDTRLDVLERALAGPMGGGFAFPIRADGEVVGGVAFASSDALPTTTSARSARRRSSSQSGK